MRPTIWTTCLVLALACEPAPRHPQTASAYSDSAGRFDGSDDGTAGTLTGIELQAKPLIPAMRDQLRRLSAQTPEQAQTNLSAHKAQLSDLVTAMQADLARSGQGSDTGFRALSDSVTDDLGGGTGEPNHLSPKELRSHIQRVERLISLYESSVRNEQG